MNVCHERIRAPASQFLDDKGRDSSLVECHGTAGSKGMGAEQLDGVAGSLELEFAGSLLDGGVYGAGMKGVSTWLGRAEISGYDGGGGCCGM